MARRRPRWNAERRGYCREADVSAMMVARKHGISPGQLRVWRQQLSLRRALGAGADSVPNLARSCEQEGAEKLRRDHRGVTAGASCTDRLGCKKRFTRSATTLYGVAQHGG
jgi:transposase-like protein